VRRRSCIAYGTAPTPLGPWTYRGVILDTVSSTTSHPGIAEFKGRWYLAYHTADAEGGGHFRHSVAIDRLEWDDSVSPARILKVKQTHEPQPPATPSRNVAPAAHASASNEPVPVQYWIKAINDGIVRANPLPPDMWASWTPHNPPSQWIQYEWAKPVTLNESRILFWADRPAGSDEGVAPPAAWHLEYWSGEAWRPVVNRESYPTPAHRLQRSASIRSRHGACERCLMLPATEQNTLLWPSRNGRLWNPHRWLWQPCRSSHPRITFQQDVASPAAELTVDSPNK
jgi:hypothetical protein